MFRHYLQVIVKYIDTIVQCVSSLRGLINLVHTSPSFLREIKTGEYASPKELLIFYL